MMLSYVCFWYGTSEQEHWMWAHFPVWGWHSTPHILNGTMGCHHAVQKEQCRVYSAICLFSARLGVGGRGRWFLHPALQKVCFQLSLPGWASNLPLPHTSDFLVTQMPFSCQVAAIPRLLLQGLSPSPLPLVLVYSKERQKLIVLSPPIPASHFY